MTKICTKCGEEKPATAEYFRKAKGGKNGLRGQCKVCDKEYNKEYNEPYNKQYRKEHADKVKECCDRYYKENADKIKEYGKQYRIENKEKIKEKDKLYRRSNPQRTAFHKQNRRARAKELPATLTVEQWERIKDDFGNRCAYCGKKKKLEQEHFISLSKGGGYEYGNIIPACKSCNCSKGDKEYFEWYPEQEFYSKERERKALEHIERSPSTRPRAKDFFKADTQQRG